MALSSGKTPKNMAFSTQNITKVYGEGNASVHALRGVTLDIPAGENVVFKEY